MSYEILIQQGFWMHLSKEAISNPLCFTTSPEEPLGIELCYLPSYSPQLNLIERLWKFIRNECLYSKYYANFADFKAAISNCIATANTDKKEKLDSLLTLNFQTFKKVQVLAV
jgi:hypothetical protein